MGARKLAEAVEGLAMEMKSPAEWQGRRQRGLHNSRIQKSPVWGEKIRPRAGKLISRESE